MIARITIVTVAVATLVLLNGTAQAQYGQPYPTVQAGHSTCDDGGADVGCTGAADPDCADGWLTSRRLGMDHHPNCRCPRCQPRHTWASFDALLWWGKGRSVPAAATTGANGGALPDAGVLFGNGNVGNELAAGARTDFGFWFDQCESLGMGAKIWGIQGDGQGYYASSPEGDPILARPFYNIVLDQPDAYLVASPGLIVGNLNMSTSSSVLGGETYLRSSIMSGRGYDIDLLGGYHFVRLDDDLTIFSNSMSIDPAGAVAIGTLIDVLDVFDARNEFHGGELGVASEIRRGCWTLTGLAKLSVGNMRQSVLIDGSRTITPPASVSAVTRGGVLAEPSNMGTYTRDKTAWIPEIGVTAAYEVRRWMRLTVGYNAIWFSNVVFSGDQIDTVVNPTQFNDNPLIGPARPAFAFRDTEYWLHGLTLGATITY